MTKKLGRKAIKLLKSIQDIPPWVWQNKRLILVSVLTLAASIIGPSGAGSAGSGDEQLGE